MAEPLGCNTATEADSTPEKRTAGPSTPSTAEGALRDEAERREMEEGLPFGERDEDAVSSDCSSDEEEEEEEGKDSEAEAEEEELDDEQKAIRASEAAREAEVTRRMKILNFVEQMQSLRAKTQGSRDAATRSSGEREPPREEGGDEEAAGEADEAAVAAAAPQEGVDAKKEAMLQKLKRMKGMMDALKEAKEAKDPDKERYDAYVAGSECYDEGDFVGAIQHFSKVLRLKPDDVDTLSRRGQAKSKLGDVEGALADFGEALRQEDDRADLYFMRASIRSDAGDDDGAMADFEESLRHDDRQPDVYCCRGTLRLERGDVQGAVDDCTAALDVDASHAGAWGLRGAARHRLGEHEGAVSDCERALHLDDDLDWIRPTLEAARKAAEAAEKRGRGEAKDGESTLWRVFGNNLFREGSLKEAVAAYSAAVQNKEEGWVLALSNQALCHLRLGEYPEAVEAADRCLQEEGAPVKIHFTKFKALAAQREWDKAYDALAVLRALPDLPAEIAAVADEEERAKRQEQASLEAA